MTQPITIWIATTDGEDCPLHATPHWTQAEAEARVRRDLYEDCPPHQRESLAALTGDELRFAWNNRNGGACIIEAHEMPRPEMVDELVKHLVAAVHALRSYQYGNSSLDLAQSIADYAAAVLKETVGISI